MKPQDFLKPEEVKNPLLKISEILTMEEKNNPFEIFKDFFRYDYSIIDWRDNLQALFLGIARDSPYHMSDDPAKHLSCISEFEKLIAAGYYLSTPRSPNRDLFLGKASEVDEANLVPPSILTIGDKWTNLHFLPRFLDKKEILNPMICIEDFFRLQDLNEWVEILRKWSNTCLSEQTFNSTWQYDDIIIDFNQFNKLLEASFLIYLREFLLAEMDEAARRIEKEKRVEEELVKIRWFFSTYPIAWSRTILKTLKEGFFSSDVKYAGGSPGEFMHSKCFIIDLINSADLLLKHMVVPDPTINLEACHVFIPKEGNLFQIELNDVEQYPHHLTGEEIVDPFQVLFSFFKLSSKEGWEDLLDLAYIDCLSEYDLLERTFDDKTFIQFDYLLKFLEACHLIYIREYLLPRMEEESSNNCRGSDS
ncbi:hypothetical protein [Litoribacter populi]|uniref:hypothetical protein n=1 Tax=Litoribacter populi TaxID=2598460 RepID=UPI0011803911|nr:hypothetical protein [Litoribacter populi]